MRSFASSPQRAELLTITAKTISKQARIKKLIVETTSMFGETSSRFDEDDICSVCFFGAGTSCGCRREFDDLKLVPLFLSTERNRLLHWSVAGRQ